MVEDNSEEELRKLLRELSEEEAPNPVAIAETGSVESLPPSPTLDLPAGEVETEDSENRKILKILFGIGPDPAASGGSTIAVSPTEVSSTPPALDVPAGIVPETPGIPEDLTVRHVKEFLSGLVLNPEFIGREEDQSMIIKALKENDITPEVLMDALRKGLKNNDALTYNGPAASAFALASTFPSPEQRKEEERLVWQERVEKILAIVFHFMPELNPPAKPLRIGQGSSVTPGSWEKGESLGHIVTRSNDMEIAKPVVLGPLDEEVFWVSRALNKMSKDATGPLIETKKGKEESIGRSLDMLAKGILPGEESKDNRAEAEQERRHFWQREWVKRHDGKSDDSPTR